ncbi:MAG TPA: YtoQ family protein [Solirubrobacterales bacterium]|nr:YtoQ family protein [Solirubrobacterales bacterium]
MSVSEGVSPAPQDPPAARVWSVYLAGEIHSDWRGQIEAGARSAQLPVVFTSPVTDHAASDAAGTDALGEESNSFWRDQMGAGVNAIRTQTLIRDADVVVVRFGDRYRQWNAAFDAGYAAALGKPIVTLHAGELDHALKEVDRAAQATARTAAQVVDVLRYVLRP